MTDRNELANLVLARLGAEREGARSQYRAAPLPYFVVDDLLPRDAALSIAHAFPPTERMALKRSLRELKFVTAQMNQCARLLEEAIFAFQDGRIISLIADITGLEAVEPDSQLYAGGISTMVEGHFLNPHVDNSHDRERERYRVLNLLYYVSPDWDPRQGGNLELWPDGPTGRPIVIESLFNRLVVMATSRRSWHSVSAVRATASQRCCVSNYYFSRRSPEETDYFHVTSFRGRPEQPVRDLVLRADIALRMLLRKVRPRGVVANPHYYRR